MFEIALLLCPFLLVLGIGGAITKTILRIPTINRWFTSLFRSLPLGRDEVQELNEIEKEPYR